MFSADRLSLLLETEQLTQWLELCITFPFIKRWYYIEIEWSDSLCLNRHRKWRKIRMIDGSNSWERVSRFHRKKKRVSLIALYLLRTRRTLISFPSKFVVFLNRAAINVLTRRKPSRLNQISANYLLSFIDYCGEKKNVWMVSRWYRRDSPTPIVTEFTFPQDRLQVKLSETSRNGQYLWLPRKWMGSCSNTPIDPIVSGVKIYTGNPITIACIKWNS